MTTKPMTGPDRQAAFRRGLAAENRAAAYLVGQGFEIVAQRFRTKVGEIDLIARRENLIVFCEVKARVRLEAAAYSVNVRQQRRVLAAAEAWLSEQPDHAACDLRFDVILFAPGSMMRHLPGAFDASE